MAIQNEDQGTKPLPIWISIPVILLCLSAGAWMIHWYVISDPISHDLKVLAEPAKVSILPNFPNPFAGQRRPGGGNGPGNRNPDRNQTPPFVYVVKDESRWQVRTETAEEFTNLNAAGQITTFRAFYTNNTVVPRQARETLIAAEALLKKGKDHLDALKLSPEDQQKLRNLSFNPNEMVLTPTDRILSRELMLKYIHTPEAQRPALQPELFKMLDGVAERSKSATAQGATDRARQINQIITPEMWKLSQTFAANPPVKTAPTTR